MDETIPTLLFTTHAARQMRKRGLTPVDIEYVYAHGALLYQQDIIFCMLRRRDIPRQHRRRQCHLRLAGTVLLLHSGLLITAYRNPAAYRAILRKSKYALALSQLTRQWGHAAHPSRIELPPSRAAARLL